MRKIKLFISMLIIMFILPVIVKAFTSLEISTPNPPVGTSFFIQINLDYLRNDGSDPEIKDFHVVVSYDPTYFDYVDVTWMQGVYDINVTEGKIYIDKDDNGRYWSAKVSPVMLRFTVKEVGITEMSVNRNGDSHYRNGDIIAQSFSGVTISSVKPSTNTEIGSIGVEGYNMEPTFKKSTTNYYVTVPADVTSVKVIAKPIDKKQTVIGGGTVYLNYGKNVHEIVVKAQDGSTRTYTITITRKDNRTGDTTLKSITVSDTSIHYKEGVTDYSATVSRSVDNVLISARTNDPNATMTGTGRKALKIGENHFQIYVTSSNNTETVYNINITRSTEELERIIQSSKLKTLRVNNLGLDLSNEKTLFLVGVRNDVHNLPIEAVGESQTATIDITGDKDLKEGINAVNIVVKELLEEATETTEEKALITEYKVLVYRNPDNTEVVSTIDKVNTTKNPVFVTSQNANHRIPADTVKYIANNNKTLYYNVVNIYNGLLYQAIISKNLNGLEIDASFKETEEGSNDYYTLLPEGTKILLYVGDTYTDETSVRIYTYSQDKGYKLLTDGLTVLNGYIEFTLNGDTNYVITLNELIKEKGPIDRFFDSYGTIIGVTVFIIVIVVMYFVILNKYKEKKASKEPSY
ncbi:MAG: cadherin-like beta sandwich domain-containing protein [Bacilli bacterium]|nr:cadherin-like beta sandwich domain-containing protein [Bacilli bacterium]